MIMRRWMLWTLVFASGMASAARATTVTFEDQGLAANSYLNNASPSSYFVSGGNSFNNSYNASFDAWSGWAISSSTDTATPGYGNQYSAIAGSGAEGSATYGVAFPSGDATLDFSHPAESFIDLAPGTSPVSIQVTNTTYAYFSMLNGDAFAKQFGAGDYFLLDIRGYDGLDGTGSLVGTVNFYLANFLGSTPPYIVNTWQTLDLTSLAGAQSLRFGLSSSDNGNFGMNTPAYVAVDHLQWNVVPEPSALWLLAAGLLGLMMLGRKRRHGSSAKI